MGDKLDAQYLRAFFLSQTRKIKAIDKCIDNSNIILIGSVIVLAIQEAS